MNRPIVQTENLSITLGGNPILDRVSLSVLPGEYVSVIGPNGAGKSTLVKCLAGIHRHWSGSVRIDGHPVGECSSREAARLRGYVPQADGRAVPLTVGEFVATGRYPYLSAFTTLSAADHAAIDAAIARAGLEPLRRRAMDTLSGGERQMAFIAAALAQEPRILLLDEPSTFLDYRHQAAVAALLESACRDHGTAILAVHHDVNTALAASHRIVAVKEGRVAFAGTPEQLADPRTLESIYATPFQCLEHAGRTLAIPGGGE